MLLFSTTKKQHTMRSSIVLFLASCLCATGAFAGTVKLHGKITNPISDSIYVRYSESWVGYDPTIIGTRLDKEGRFSLSFPLKEKYTEVTILHGEQGTELMPSPGDDLGLTVNAKDFDSTLHYDGKGADIANFIAAHMIARGFSYVFSSRVQGASALSPDSFETRSHESLKKETGFLAAHGAGLPESFRKFWMSYFQYALYEGGLNYATFHEVQKQHSYSISKFEPEDYIPVRRVPAKFDDAMLNISSYRYYLTGYYYGQLTAAAWEKGEKPNVDDKEVLRMVLKNMPPGSAEVYEASTIYMHVKTDTIAVLHDRLAAFKKRYPHSEYLPLLTDKITHRDKIAAGSPALDFTINTVDGKTMKLSDLKGKVVFMDFWASWCGPCMGEMPYAKKIEERYKGKDVVFVYVSIDADEAAWKKKMDELQLAGLHMRDGAGGWSGPVATLYGVQGVPSYFLIDKNGRYALDSAPRPSATDELTAAIDRLLQ